MKLPATLSHWFSTVTAKSNRIWLTPAVWSVLAVIFALLASWLGGVVPEVWVPNIDLETLDDLLSVVSTSMLTVTTFSLSIMVSAFANASSSTTPRSTSVVMSDEVTHAAIASFLSAFVYAIIAKTALGLGYYGNAGRLVLLIGTLLVMMWLIIMLIRWVKTLSSLGLVSNTLDKLERQARNTLERHHEDPALGFTLGRKPTEGTPLFAPEVGYLRRISPGAVRNWAVENDTRVHVCHRPGALLDPTQPLAIVSGRFDEPTMKSLRSCFQLDAERSYDQDPRYGLIALSEVAERALSSAVNDPGTAIQVLARLARALIETLPNPDDSTRSKDAADDGRERVTIEPLDDGVLVSESFEAVARDGANLAEVQIRLQKALGIVARNGTPAMAAEAKRLAQVAMDRADDALPSDHDRRQLADSHSEVWG